jgi:hypothetical protein
MTKILQTSYERWLTFFSIKFVNPFGMTSYLVRFCLVSSFFLGFLTWLVGLMEQTDNNSPLLVPNASASLQQARLSSSNNELQSQGLNEVVVGPFASSNGSFTSTTPDGGAQGNPAFMANGVLDDHGLQRSCSSHWSPVAATPVRTFTKVFCFLGKHSFQFFSFVVLELVSHIQSLMDSPTPQN